MPLPTKRVSTAVAFIPIFVAFPRRHWYRKKTFMIPITLLATVFIAAAIVGSILGARSQINVSRTCFDFLFS